MKISPRPVAIGPSDGSTPSGKRDTASRRRSLDELAREVDVGAVLEDDRDLREPVARERARVLEPRQARERGLDRERDALLRLRAANSPGASVLICTCTFVMSGTASIGSRRELEGAEAGGDERHAENEPATRERGANDGIEHDDS